ncbi:DUF1015 domain-containing protein [Aliifodinibius sp. S!AR15-10]|uniref:DUF1015 domain-containing protein n=1 Tax=Aliifodinibius sp. S!AR15-10 TaxID=2950437 RepID=UPI00286393BA|nr:DUF1015 domain-containing protein [Aliifodinibius sp. S!AR15-10]MDR8392075.1 DUF1015 domain-containing protein [Aliifodinibius sp. S!AR15-10]
MAIIHPFKAWRPRREKLNEVACVPYDVINTEEAQSLAEGKPDSFLHVIRPEIDLPEGTKYNEDSVYEKGAENLARILDSDLMTQEEEESVYIYRLIREGRSQTGLFTCVSVDDYDNEVILKHELTRPDKEDDRTLHILTQSAHAEPVMMTFKDTKGIASTIEDVMDSEEPLYDFTAADDIQHTIWKVPDAKELISDFEDIPHLYIADGHHRCKSASRAAAEMKKANPNYSGEEEFNFFPAVLFPMDEMKILAYNRIIYSVPDDFLSELKDKFELTENAEPSPSEKGSISIYYDGTWYGMELPQKPDANSVEKLDVHRLQEAILEPMLDITDQRRDENISFVGGIRGTEELERLVDSGKADLAISMYPTDIAELVEVSDEGLLMPPKSTWFEPKLRSGLLIHTF